MKLESLKDIKCIMKYLKQADGSLIEILAYEGLTKDDKDKLEKCLFHVENTLDILNGFLK